MTRRIKLAKALENGHYGTLFGIDWDWSRTVMPEFTKNHNGDVEISRTIRECYVGEKDGIMIALGTETRLERVTGFKMVITEKNYFAELYSMGKMLERLVGEPIELAYNRINEVASAKDNYGQGQVK